MEESEHQRQGQHLNLRPAFPLTFNEVPPWICSVLYSLKSTEAHSFIYTTSLAVSVSANISFSSSYADSSTKTSSFQRHKSESCKHRDRHEFHERDSKTHLTISVLTSVNIYVQDLLWTEEQNQCSL